MKRICLLIGLLLAIALYIVPSTALGQEPKYGGKLIYALEGEVNNVDPHKCSNTVESGPATLYTESLVFAGKDYEPLPGLAESWDVSADGLEYVFHLRKGIKFHNGREMTAEDVKWNFDRMFDPKTVFGIRSRFDAVASYEVVDKYTFKFTLKTPSASFIRCFAGGYAQAPIIAPECLNEDGTVTHPIGTGPFEFVGWEPLNHILVKKFNDYWIKGIPYLDEVEVKMIADPVVRGVALKAGDVDIVSYLTYDDAVNLLNNPVKGLKVISSAMFTTLFIQFNVNKPPFNDKRLRQAVAYGIDKKMISDGVFMGMGHVQSQAIVPTSFWYCDKQEKPRDIEKARALMAEAGYPDGMDATLTYCTFGTFPQAVVIVQSQLKDIGMNITLDTHDIASYFAKTHTGEFTMGFCSWAMEGDPAYVYETSLATGGSTAFLTGGSLGDPDLDALLKAAGAELDQNKRKDMYCQVVDTLLEEAPYINIAQAPGPVGLWDYVKGYEPMNVGLWPVYGSGGLQYTWLDK